MPMNELVSYCGGSSKAIEIKQMIVAYQDMQKYYRPLCSDDSMFNIKKFHGFVELQKRNVLEMMLSRLVDIFFSRISWTTLLYAENYRISVA